jgi:DNA-directed RNA polymerase omega subunit
MAKKAEKKQEPDQEEKEVSINPDAPVEEQYPLNELPTLFPNSYEVVVAAARRARQLNLGLRALVLTNMSRPVDVALAELAARRVEYELVEDENRDPTAPRSKSRSK